MFKGNIHSEFCVISEFVEDNIDTIDSICKEVVKVLPRDDAEDEDDYKEQMAVYVGMAILGNATDFDNPIAYDDKDIDILCELTRYINTYLILKSLEKKGLIHEVDTGRYTAAKF